MDIDEKGRINRWDRINEDNGSPKNENKGSGGGGSGDGWGWCCCIIVILYIIGNLK